MLAPCVTPSNRVDETATVAAAATDEIEQSMTLESAVDRFRKGLAKGSASTQCAIHTGISAAARKWRVTPPNNNCLARVWL